MAVHNRRDALAAEGHDVAVTDTKLIGFWSDDPLYMGAMESNELVFTVDGVGWLLLSRPPLPIACAGP